MKRSTPGRATGSVTVAGAARLRGALPNWVWEFTGGRVMTFSVTEELNADQARELSRARRLRKRGGPGGRGRRDLRAHRAISDQEAAKIQDALAEEGGEVERTSDEKIGPSMGGELRNKALTSR